MTARSLPLAILIISLSHGTLPADPAGSVQRTRIVDRHQQPLAWDTLLTGTGREAGTEPDEARMTIDARLQEIVHDGFRQGLETFHAAAGTVIVMDPKTGAILAMTSQSPDQFAGPDQPAGKEPPFAIAAAFEPGSIFKIVAASAALDQAWVTYDTLIDCHEGIYKDGALRVPDHKPYGMLPVWRVIQKSSNIGSYMIATKLGPGGFHNHARALGFGEITGIGIPGENSGILRDTANQVDFSRQSYGYSLAATPIQIAAAYAAIANDGMLMRPRLIEAVSRTGDSEWETHPPVEVRRVMGENTARDMRKMLATVCTDEGNAPRAKVPGHTVAGMSATTRKHGPKDGRRLPEKFIASFAGMLPAGEPAFVCVVVVDDPRPPDVRPYGGTVAAPIFSQIAARLAKEMKLEPSAPDESGD